MTVASVRAARASPRVHQPGRANEYPDPLRFAAYIAASACLTKLSGSTPCFGDTAIPMLPSSATVTGTPRAVISHGCWIAVINLFAIYTMRTVARALTHS